MDVGSAVRGLVKESCRLVDSADSPDAIAAITSVLHAALVAGRADASSYAGSQTFKGREAAWQQALLYLDQLDDARRRLGSETAANAARACFFWLSFDQWAAVLMTVTAAASSPARQQQQPGLPEARIQLLLGALLQLAPAPVVLQTLASHLSLVSLADGSGGAARVTARGADLAAAVLAHRFAAPGCTGVAELLLHLALSHQQQQQQGQNQHQQRHQHQQQHEVAGGVAPGSGQRDNQDAPVALSNGAATGGSGSSGSSSSTSGSSGSGGDGGAGGGAGQQQGLAPEDERVLRRLLLLQPVPGSEAQLAGAGLYDTGSLAGMLVSVPDRAAGLLSAPSGCGPASLASSAGIPGDEALLQPEPFYWRLQQQLVGVLADPGGSTAAALARLRRCSAIRGAALRQSAGAAATAAPTEASQPSLEQMALSEAGARADGGYDGGDDDDDEVGGLSADGAASLERLVASAAVRLLAELLERLAKRGHAAAAADALLACTTSLAAAYDTGYGAVHPAATLPAGGDGGAVQLREGCTAALLQVADASSAALERLLAALLDRGAAAAAVVAAAAAAGSGAGADATSHAVGFEDSTAQGAQQQNHQQQSQQQLEALFGLTPPLGPPALAAAVTALSWLLPPRLAEHPAVSYILTDRLLLSLQRPPLPYDSLQLLTALLPAAYPVAQPAAAAGALAAAWGDAATVTRTSVQRQAYLAQELLLLLARMDRAGVEGTPGLLGALLGGVSQRLGSPLVATQRQAMRVGRAFSLLLDPASDLFGDMGELGLGPEELWPGALPRRLVWRPTSAAAGEAAASGAASQSAATRNEHDVDVVTASAAAASGGDIDDGDGSVCTATDSDDEDGRPEYDDDELRPLGSAEELEGDPEAEAWRRAEPSSLQLRSLAAALRRQEDVTAVLGALKRLEVVIRAAPDELPLVAPELVRSLLHCRVPEWAEPDEPGAGGGSSSGTAAGSGNQWDSSPAAQRHRSLVALLAVAPLQAGDALVPEVYSPHLDLHQRLTLLDALAAGAAELADPRVAPRLTQGPGGRPLLQRPDPTQTTTARPAALTEATAQLATSRKGRLAAAGAAGEAGGGGGSGGRWRRGSVVDAASDGSRRRGPRTRVWGPVALRKRKEEQEAAAVGRQAAGAATFRNRFADVALRWAAGLLREVDRVKHGVDLLGRDHQLLGRLLSTLAAFTEAAAGSGALPPLANATLELIRSPEVHAHPEPYVRRASLLAAGQVLAQLPPAVVAGALLGAGGSGAGSGAGLGVFAGLGLGGSGGGGGGGALAERLEWVAEWSRATSEGDVDPHCRMMAQACVNLQADLASRCLTSLQDAASTATQMATTMPTLDLARTARMLTSSVTPGLTGVRSGGAGAGLSSAAAALVTDVSVW